MAAFKVITEGKHENCCPAGTCEHRDCAENHRQAQATCPSCGELIGYDTYYVIVNMEDSKQFSGAMPVHQDCFWRDRDAAYEAGRPTIYA